MQHFKTISEMHRAGGFPPPLHPLISLYRCGATCSIVETEFTSDFYLISLKKLKAGIIRYGQTKYDHANGSMAFIKPRQVAEFRNLEFEEDAFIIFMHEDFLHGHPLHSAIKKYGFFEYEVNEALHLSPKEEELIWDLYNRIDAEYRNNPDEFSRGIIPAVQKRGWGKPDAVQEAVPYELAIPGWVSAAVMFSYNIHFQ